MDQKANKVGRSSEYCFSHILSLGEQNGVSFTHVYVLELLCDLG